MRGLKKIINGEIGNFLNENNQVAGKTIINVDIQPEDESAFTFQDEWSNFEANEIRELLEHSDDMVYIPELMDYL